MWLAVGLLLAFFVWLTVKVMVAVIRVMFVVGLLLLVGLAAVVAATVELISPHSRSITSGLRRGSLLP